MATPLTEIYDYFLSKFDDLEFMEVDEDDSLKFRYLKNAIPNFRHSKKSLEIVEGEFLEALSNTEIAILGELMVLEYLAPQINSLNLLKQGFNTRDFTRTSQAAHLNALRSLKRDIEISVKTRMVQYTYEDNGVSTWKK